MKKKYSTGSNSMYEDYNNFNCPACGGDGKETCNNPDHGFIGAMPGDVGRHHWREIQNTWSPCQSSGIFK